MPWTYRHATKEWRAILDDAKDQMGLVSDNMAYTAIEGVLLVFRRRLTPQEGIAFAAILPAVPRAIFVKDWDLSASPLPFGDRQAMTQEAQGLRPNHNLTPDNAIEATAFALRRAISRRDFERVLRSLPEGAMAFWHVDGANEADLQPRIV